MNDTETFQHYQVLRHEDGSLWELGRGAMGVTYKAFDTNLRCHVALKVVSSQLLDSETARARFLREARAAAGLRHRNIASVYHLGNDAEAFFYSMEFIDGETVASLVGRQGPLPAAEALQITLQVTRALGAAAKQGVVHRDIKPANLMVVREDDDEAAGGFVVKVIDFGLARSVLAGSEHSAITLGGFVGTPQYASPEQIEERPLDVRSDIYSLGITLWYMLAGHPPFTGTVFRVSSQHLTKEPPWGDLEGTVPPPVCALLGRMLQKDPALRPENPGKLRAEINACLRGLPALFADGAATQIPTGGADLTLVPRPAPLEGQLFADRYQLVERVGESASGRTFRASDNRLDGKLVALKIFAPTPLLDSQAFSRWQDDLERLCAAPHPQLIQPFSLERRERDRFLVMEWVNGYPLAEGLRLRGAWPLPDALRLLGLVADAATHAHAQRLHGLELSPRKILLSFPEVGDDDPPPGAETLADRSLHHWPSFTLKLNALNPTGETGKREPAAKGRGMAADGYYQALAFLFHELMGGKLPAWDRAQDLPPLPDLNEAGNALLRRACSGEPGFATENAWFDALLAGTGQRREGIGLAPAQAGGLPSPPGLVPGPSRRPGNPPGAFRQPPEEARTLARDEAATLIEAEPPAPFPVIPVEARIQPEPTLEGFAPSRARPAAAPLSGPPSPIAAEPEVVPLIPTKPTEQPPAYVDAVQSPMTRSTAVATSKPVLPPTPIPARPVPATAVELPPTPRKFPLVPGLALTALAVGGLTAAMTFHRLHRSAPLQARETTPPAPALAASTPSGAASPGVPVHAALPDASPPVPDAAPATAPTPPPALEEALPASGPAPEPAAPGTVAAPIPTVAQVPGVPAPPTVPAIPPRRDHKAASPQPTAKANLPLPVPAKGAVPPKGRGALPKPTPAKSLKPGQTPPHKDEDVPGFMR